MKVCSWNVNSIRARKELLFAWLERRNFDIDVLCLQELKVEEPLFPYKDFEEKGYKCAVNSQKRYNGVCICSKYDIQDVLKGFSDEYFDQQKRVIAAKIKDIWIINLYVPHGDIRGTDKYYYKLDWYKKLYNWLNQHFSPTMPIIMTGDFNVALEDIDVYDPELLRDSIGTMEEERQALKKILDWGFIDTFRYLHPDKQEFTWWDYIGGAFWKNEGMRIDYILCTKPLIDRLKSVEIDLWPRKKRKPKPSDHAPVIAEFDI